MADPASAGDAGGGGRRSPAPSRSSETLRPSSETLTTASQASTTFSEEILTAERPNLSGLRRRLDSWLTDQGATRTDVDGVVLACSEAVANAVEHGCEPECDECIKVVATCRNGTVTVLVDSPGPWDPSPSKPHRGHGLRLIEHLMQQVQIVDDDGTVVRMQRQLSS